MTRLALLAAGTVVALGLASDRAEAGLPEVPPERPSAFAIAEADIVAVMACGPRCGVNRRVSRRTARRTSRRVSNRNDYYRRGGVVVVEEDHDNTAAVGIAAGIAGLAVGAAIANSANHAPPSGDYPY